MSTEHLRITLGIIIYTVLCAVFFKFVVDAIRKQKFLKKDVITERPKVMPAPQKAYQPIKDETMEAPPSVSNRYPMCKDQIAQIDCRVKDCNYNLGTGKCSNVSPAITLHDGGKFLCWSQEDKAKLGKTN